MNAPAISICVPTYQARQYLPETLASVRAQTWTDWELLVTEDGSDDGTAAVVREFAASVRQPVYYQRHRVNRGLPATRNSGITNARAPWIALLDSDDLWAPDHLESLMATSRREPADLIHAGSQLFDSDTGAFLERRAPSPADLAGFPRTLFEGSYMIQPASVMVRKQLWADVGGFDPTFRYVEDRDMWLRCARQGARFAYTGKETCFYRKHVNALSRNATAMAVANARAFAKHLDWEAFPAAMRRSLTAEAWVSAGRLALRANPALARNCFGRAWSVRRSAPRPAAYWCYALLRSLTRPTAPSTPTL